MNPWWLTFGLFAFGTVMLLIGFGNGHKMGYEAGLEDGVMIQKRAEEKAKAVMAEIYGRSKAEEPSDEDAA